MTSIWKKIQTIIKPAQKNSSNYATIEDVQNCYRILLNREPDEAGWAYWANLIQNQNISINMMADGFLRSFEFKQRQAERNKPHLVKLPNYKIYVRKNDLFVGSIIAKQKIYEPVVTNAIQRYLKTGHVFVDIGANIGYFSLLAASLVGEDGDVYAFEPIPENGDFINLSIAENGFKNVTLYRNAVAESRQTITFTGGGADSNGRIINASETNLTNYPLPTIEAITLDETLKNITRLDLIKMDIEGAEPRAFAGMKNLIHKFHPIILTEFSPEFIKVTSGTDPIHFLNELIVDYTLAILDEANANQHTPRTITQIMEACTQSNHTHLDLIAIPQ